MASETAVGIELHSNNKECREKYALLLDPLKNLRLSEKIINETDEYTEELFKMLIDEEEDEFIAFITNLASQNNRPNLNCNNGHTTYLQYACRHRLNKVAEYLIQSGADLCAVCESTALPPLFEAIIYQNNIAVIFIIETNHNQLFMNYMGENILHCTAAVIKEPISDTLNVLFWILVKIRYCNIKEALHLLHEENSFGETPLGIAIENGNDGIIFTLLENGVDMFRKNKRGESIFLNMYPSTLEKYFDRKLTTVHNVEANQMGFDFTSIIPPECFNGVSEETSRIVYLSQLPDFRNLIKHPVVSTLIHLKWQKVKWLFYLNLLVYVLFCCSFTGHMLLNKEDQAGYSKILVLIFLYILAGREIFQVYISPLRYIRQLENWIEVPLVMTTLLTLFTTTTTNPYHQQVSAVALFLTWGELFLLIGRYPNLSTQVEMYKRVSLHFLKYFICYSLVIIAFALTFYVLFYDSSNEKTPVINILSNVTTAMYDTFLRLGDLNGDSVPIKDHPVIGRVFFIMFLLFIFVIMLNLLNGLAVSDTQAIIDEAELFVLISRLKFIFIVEKISKIFGNKIRKKINVINRCSPRIKNYTLISGNDIDPDVLKTAKQIRRNSRKDAIEDKFNGFFHRFFDINKSVDKKIIRIDSNIQVVRDTLKNEDKLNQLLDKIDDISKSAEKNVQRIDNKVDDMSATLTTILDRIDKIEHNN